MGVFAELLLRGIKAGQVPARTKEARDWYRNEARQIKKVNNNQLMREEKADLVGKIELGRMYLFMYDPKTKATLPYYDNAPLVFPFKKVKGGFLGLNIHYLPPVLRIKLMDALYDTLNNKKFDETTKLRLSYGILNSAAKYKYFVPCVKHYLNDHIRSRFLQIHITSWETAAMLPLARWAGGHGGNVNTTVYNDSRKKI
jgi:hypothetical protein